MIPASLDRFAEDVVIKTVVISELKFCDVQREVFAADLVIGANDATLNQRPEASIRDGPGDRATSTRLTAR